VESSLHLANASGYDFSEPNPVDCTLMPIVFELKSKPNLPLDVRDLVPGRICEMTTDQIGNLEIGFGNQIALVSQWFDVSGNSDDKKVIFKGALDNVHSVGHSMTSGSIEIQNSIGRHVGASMSGGQIVIRGNVDDYLGYEMIGGTIVVHGNAADHVGGCYPGAKYGMNRGTILISGSAGKGLGYRMRRGTIVVGGDVGEHAAWQMRAGTVMVFGKCDGSPGIDMRRGTIVVGGTVETAATFSQGQESGSSIVAMLQRWLAATAAKNGIEFSGVDRERFRIWHGDALSGGRGELFAVVD